MWVTKAAGTDRSTNPSGDAARHLSAAPVRGTDGTGPDRGMDNVLPVGNRAGRRRDAAGRRPDREPQPGLLKTRRSKW
ncbi:hypothetical protein GCM10010377_64630 [Streptomyces viridiviolaceus]|nr:hypothetical protein GCM10010377_64630 [Streptomyces viridiviolaceus]